MTYRTPIRPRVTPAEFWGYTGAILDLPGMRGRGVFIARHHLDRVLDQLDHIADGGDDQ